MAPTVAKTREVEGLQQSARQKRSVDEADDEMEASCTAEAETLHGDDEVMEDSTTKRPKTGDSTGMRHCCPLAMNY